MRFMRFPHLADFSAPNPKSAAQYDSRRRPRLRNSARWASNVSAAAQDDPHRILQFLQQLKMALTASCVSTAAQDGPHRSAHFILLGCLFVGQYVYHNNSFLSSIG